MPAGHDDEDVAADATVVAEERFRRSIVVVLRTVLAVSPEHCCSRHSDETTMMKSKIDDI
jgi:hypothetical protein